MSAALGPAARRRRSGTSRTEPEPAEQHIAPLVRESTPGIIAEKLRNAIGSGELAPGTQLGETDLARRLGVSRGPLREGMQRLTQEGLLVSIRNRGLFVIEMTPENARDMYVARAAVERAAAEQIFNRDPAAAGARLAGVVKKMERFARRRDHTAVGAADIEFHQLLVSLAGSPRLSRMHDTLLTETKMCIHALDSTYHDPDERVAEHQAIAEAFTKDRPALADQLLVAHMDDAIIRLAATVPHGTAVRIRQHIEIGGIEHPLSS